MLDPACGSGGFLLYALDAVRREAHDYHPDANSVEHYKHWHDFAEKQLFGIEINDEICRVAKMNMIIHDDGHSNVIGEDALQPIKALTNCNAGLTAGSFDLIFTNPPFGATLVLTAHPYLAGYTLGKARPDAKGRQKPRRTQRTEVLFIERVWELLTAHGHAAIVLPDGILNNRSSDYVREFVLERFQVLAVVSLPASAFAHFGAGVKASIVFLRKRAEGETPREDEATFMAAPEKIGYDATGRETDNELPEVAEAYREFLRSPAKFLA